MIRAIVQEQQRDEAIKASTTVTIALNGPSRGGEAREDEIVVHGHVARAIAEEVEAIALKDDKVAEVTGATKSSGAGKGRLDLLPPWAIIRLAKHYQEGTVGPHAYPARDWEKGIRISRYVDSALRHLLQGWGGLGRGEPHFVAAFWNLCCLVETLHRVEIGVLPKELDDRVVLEKEQEMEEQGIEEARKETFEASDDEVERMWKRVRGVARAMIGDYHLAEEMTAEVTLKLIEKRTREGELSFIMLKHMMIDALRKYRRREMQSLEGDVAEPIRNDAAVKAKEKVAELMEGANLTALEGKVIYELYYLGLPLIKAALKTGLGVDKVRALKQSSLEKLANAEWRRQVAEEEESDD